MENFDELKMKILPYFVNYYGEEYTQIIIDRLNQIESIFYQTLDNEKNKIFNLKQKKKIELTLEFLEHYNFEINEKDKFKMISENSFLPLENYPEALSLLNVCFGNRCYDEYEYNGIRRFKKNQKEINASIFLSLGYDLDLEQYDDFLNSKEGIEAYNKVLEILLYIDTLNLEYQKFQKQFKEAEIKITDISNKNRELSEKRTIEFYLEIKDYLNDKDKQLIEEYQKGNNMSYYVLTQKLDIFKLVGNLNYEKGYLDAFSKESEEKISSNSILGKSIIDNRLKYYKYIGVYDGLIDQEKFLASDVALNYKPNLETIEKIYQIKERCIQELKEEMLINSSSYIENIDKINGLNLLTTPEFSLETIEKKAICNNPNVAYTENGIEIKDLLIFSKENCLPNYVDISFIHEINHAIELNLLHYENGKAIYKCGFETISDFDETRNYELFNEYINQKIAIEITEKMHNDSMYLFDDKVSAKTKGGTSYEQLRNVADYFFENFKDVILKSRLENNLNSLFEVISEEKFNELNNIINEYAEIPYYQVMQDIQNGKETELTIKRQELINVSHTVVNQMLEQCKHKNI